MQEAHFKNICNKLKALLIKANNTVDIAMAWFTNADLFYTLEECVRRGVKVRLILLDDPINFMEYAPDFNRLIECGGNLYIASANIGFMHHKFCIVDNKIIVSGSYNWTYYAESRNLENVFFTDDSSVISAYQEEFNHLAGLISMAKSSPRLAMTDIEALDNIDFHELNNEIENICRVQNRPVKRIFETHTQVIMNEIKSSPVSKYNIGILNSDDEVNLDAEVFIKAGSKLPVTNTVTMYFDSHSEHECPCKIIKYDGNNASLVKEEDILRIAKGTNNPNLPIRFSMRLDDNGSLRVDVSCEISGQYMTISTLDKNLVRYE